MTLDTLKVPLDQKALLKLLAIRTKRNEEWSLIGISLPADGIAVLGLFVNGGETGETINLYADGTWGANTHIVLGEKK